MMGARVLLRASPLTLALSPRAGRGNILGKLLRRSVVWLDARRRAAADRRDLANMSDRELQDIGLPRASVRAVADGAWQRDYFD